MSIKDVKAEARQKLALNIHQAIVIYTIEFTLLITLVALIALACMLCLNGANLAAAIIMLVYGVLLLLVAIIAMGMVGYAMVDFYLVSYKCRNYNIRRLGDTIARNGITKILLMNMIRTLLGFLLLLCLIVPGVIYLSRTSMASFLLNANPKMKASTALSASGKVMAGKMGAYIKLIFSLTGWYLLGIVTLGLGFLVVIPYANLSKAVFYKRCLQGDTAVYRVPVQPISPVAEMEAPPLVRTVGDADSQPTVAPVVPEQPVVASEPVAEVVEEAPAVQEVPIMPITTSKNAVPDEHPIENSDLVEIVKPLTTLEMNSSLSYMDEQVDDLYKGGKSAPKSDRDYFATQPKTAPNDFVTGEVTPIEAVKEAAAELEQEAAEPVKPDSVMDDAAFAEFMKNFNNVPTPEPEFSPLKQRDTSAASHAADTFGTVPETPVIAPEPAPAPNHASVNASERHNGFVSRTTEPPTTRNRQNFGTTGAGMARPGAGRASSSVPPRSDRSRFDRDRDDRTRNFRR